MSQALQSHLRQPCYTHGLLRRHYIKVIIGTTQQ